MGAKVPVIEEEPKELVLDEREQKAVQYTIADHNARELMAIALIRTGLDERSVRFKAQITSVQYKKLLRIYEEGNFDKLTTRVIENWGNVILAKMMNTTEKSLDLIEHCLENGDTKAAKDASHVFGTLFDKFRLSTGKSTENIATTTQRIQQMIEGKTTIQKPNQSSYHENVVTVDTKAPTLSEVM